MFHVKHYVIILFHLNYVAYYVIIYITYCYNYLHLYHLLMLFFHFYKKSSLELFLFLKQFSKILSFIDSSNVV